MVNYGQFCPVAKAAEIIGERWSLLVVRELLAGTTRFNDLQKALAKASPSILSKRLKELEQAGIIERTVKEDEYHPQYHLTRAGRELDSLIEQLGTWATRWAPSRLSRADLQEYFLMLDISRRVDRSALPAAVTIGFSFEHRNINPKWWLVLRNDNIDICDKDPGYDVDLLITASLRNLTDLWLGNLPITTARRQAKIRFIGDATLRKNPETWLGLSAFAKVRRPKIKQHISED